MAEKNLSDRDQAKQKISANIADVYLASPDFNGMSAYSLPDALKPLVVELIAEGDVYANFGHQMVNPHIIGFPQESPAQNAAEVERRGGIDSAILYPTRRFLKEHGAGARYPDEPYTTQLALGYSQLEPRFFDPAVLGRYRDDPRYDYTFDIDGRISGTGVAEDTFLATIGVGFDKEPGNDEIVIGVPLRYLRDLSPTEQGYWKSFEHERQDWVLHPDFVKPHILGEFPDRISPYEAMLREMEMVNDLCDAIEYPHLYRHTYTDTNRPTDFGYVIRPTKRELSNFVEQLNKMLIDNMDREFFKGRVDVHEQRTDTFGNEYMAPRGTIAMLKDWLHKVVRHDPDGLVPSAVKHMRNIRSDRSSVAHDVKENEHDPAVWTTQRELIVASYVTVRTIRQLLQSHPRSAIVEVPNVLDEVKVWDF